MPYFPESSGTLLIAISQNGILTAYLLGIFPLFCINVRLVEQSVFVYTKFPNFTNDNNNHNNENQCNKGGEGEEEEGAVEVQEGQSCAYLLKPGIPCFLQFSEKNGIQLINVQKILQDIKKHQNHHHHGYAYGTNTGISSNSNSGTLLQQRVGVEVSREGGGHEHNEHNEYNKHEPVNVRSSSFSSFSSFSSSALGYVPGRFHEHVAGK